MAFFAAIWFGVIEGITEWLPVSSTGHLILLSDVFPLVVGEAVGEDFPAAFRALFDVLIQVAAILAVPIRFFSRLNPLARGRGAAERGHVGRLYASMLIAGIPVAAVALLLDPLLERLTGKDIDAWLYRNDVVALALILYGVAFLFVDRGRRAARLVPLNARVALTVGGFQALAVIPGTSRSGATMLGGMLVGMDRASAAEYSFFLALPTMLGAGAIRTLDFVSLASSRGYVMPPEGYAVLLLGMAVALLVSLFTIDALMSFVKRSSLRGFGIYRILLGAVVLLWPILRG